jgi:hypothetical protein
MTAKVVRADRFLDRITGSAVTECGKDWLKIALDPFHDTQLEHLEGLPDLSDSPSVVQCVKQTMTVACPAAVTTGTWDLHLVDLPWDNPQVMTQTYLGTNTTIPFTGGNDPINFNFMGQPTGVTGRTMGGLTAISVATGASTNPALVATTQIKSLTIPSAYTVGNYRKIASGFEGISVGPALYKSGTVYVYRQSVPTNDNASKFTIAVVTPGTGAIVSSTSTQVLPFSAPPYNISDAELIPSTRSWEASKGCYVVSRFNTSKAPRYNANFNQPLMVDNYTAANTSLYHNGSAPSLVTVTAGSSPQTSLSYDQCVWNNQDLSGAYFSGLNLQDVITVNYNIYIERFPTINDLNLIVLATPSPQMDDAAIALYSQVSREMPVGVPQAENGLGDWFSGIVNTISNVVSPIARMIPHPLAQAIASASDIAGSMTKREVRQAEHGVPQAPPMGNFTVSLGSKKTFQEQINEQRNRVLKNSIPDAPAIGSLTLGNTYRNGINRFNSIRDTVFKHQGKRLGLQTTNQALNGKRYKALMAKQNKNQIFSQNHNNLAAKEKRIERKVNKIVRSKIPRAPPLSKKQRQQIAQTRAKAFNQAGTRNFGKKFMKNFSL